MLKAKLGAKMGNGYVGVANGKISVLLLTSSYRKS